ncbi:endolytic transglycosylase MltG, partial [Candidatus Woesebacteria bacterium]|nr:endolytic transglycosylase MltG [Candidatus Woesebacteria bacterium]
VNRLSIGMGLQADATVQYAVATSSNWWPVLTKDDLAINSPFNTYRFRGIPPTPIANPGLSSITAAVLPKDTDYLYYLHDAKGQIYFARTLAEHNENVRKYLGK